MPPSRSLAESAATETGVGRAAGILDRVLRSEAAGTHELEIAGEPGGSRSRLLRELAETARRRGLRVRQLPDGGLALRSAHAQAPALVARTVLPEEPVREGAERLDLTPLTRAGFASLLGPGVSRPRCFLLHALTGGLPGLLDMLHSLTDGELRVLARTGDFPGPIPGRAREPVALAPGEREIARTAAVLGDPFDPAVVAAVAGRDITSVLTTLDALASRGLVVADGAGPLFRFRHPLSRALVYARTPPGARIAAHARAAAVLTSVGAAPRTLAAHLARSAPPGDRTAVRLLTAASEETLGPDPRRARDWLDAALRIAPRDSDDALRERIPVLRQSAVDRLAALAVRESASCRAMLGQAHTALARGRIAQALQLAEEAEGHAHLIGCQDLADRAGLLQTCALIWRDGPEEGSRVAAREGLPTGPAGPDAGVAEPGNEPWWAVLPPAGLGPAPEQRPAHPGRAAHDLLLRAADLSGPAAIASLHRAAAGFADVGMALWEGHTRLVLAGRLTRSGRLAEAATEAGRAKSLALATGSGWLRRSAVDGQRAVGACRPRSGASAAPGGPVFSEREAEIVRMVRSGLPNRDIAEALFLSAKTVEAHLTRIYRKAGVRSRTALAAVAPP